MGVSNDAAVITGGGLGAARLALFDQLNGGAESTRLQCGPRAPNTAANYQQVGCAARHGYFFEPRVRKRERNSLVRGSFGASITCSGGPTSANSPLSM